MRTLPFAGTLLATGLLLAACGGGGATPVPTVASTPAPSASAAPPSAAASEADSGAPVAGPASVALADTSLGRVLVDGAGMTLYVFTADSGGTSACYGDCEKAWPVLHGDGSAPTLGDGLTASDFGTIDRTDGSKQVTFHGMPLYFFAADTKPGDVTGQGVGGKWYVVDATGALVK